MIFSYKNQSFKFIKFEKKFITRKYISWLNDKKLMKYSRHNKIIFNKKKCIEYLKLNKLNKNLFYAILVKNDKSFEHIGNILASVDHLNKRADVSILIGDKNFRNKGFGSLIWKKFIQKIEKMNKFNLITAGTKETNLKMIQIFISSKMKLLKIPSFYYFDKKKIAKIFAYRIVR